MEERRRTQLMKHILIRVNKYMKRGFSRRAAIAAAVSYQKHMINDMIEANL